MRFITFQLTLFTVFFLVAVTTISSAQQTDRDIADVPAAPIVNDSSDGRSADSMISHRYDAPQYTAPPKIEAMFVNLPGTWAGWYHREFRTENIPYYLGIGVLTTALVITDHDTWHPVRQWYEENWAFRKFCDYSEFMGQGWFQFGVAGAFALHGFAFEDNKSLHTASQTVEVILACGGVIQLLKHVTGRETPAYADLNSTGIWRFFPNQIDYHKHFPKYDAFPTGHLATAMATLTVITENYPEATWVPYIGYPAIAFIGIAMVGQSIHWWSDYPLGIAIGYSFGKVVTGRHKSAGLEQANAFSKYYPTAHLAFLSGGTPGVGFTWAW